MLHGVVIHPAIRSLLGIMLRRELSYVTGITLLVKNVGIRRPCEGCRPSVCSVLIMLRGQQLRAA